MSAHLIEITSIVISILSPLIVLYLSISLNKKLEYLKSTVTKEKDWQSWWANKFLSVADDFSQHVTEYVGLISQIIRVGNIKKDGWEAETEKLLQRTQECLNKFSLLDWEIQNYIQFAKTNGNSLMENKKKIFSLLQESVKTNYLDLEKLRDFLYEFNKDIRTVHAEMLEIPMDIE